MAEEVIPFDPGSPVLKVAADGSASNAYIQLTVYDGANNPSRMLNKDKFLKEVILPVNPSDVSVTNVMAYDSVSTIANREIARLNGKQLRTVEFEVTLPQYLFNTQSSVTAPAAPWVNSGFIDPGDFMGPEQMRIWLDALQESDSILTFSFKGTDFADITVFVEEYVLSLSAGTEDYKLRLKLKEYPIVSRVAGVKLVKVSFVPKDIVKVSGAFYKSRKRKAKKGTASSSKRYMIKAYVKGEKAPYLICDTKNKSKNYGWVTRSQMRHVVI